MKLDVWMLYALAALLLTLTPGPNSLLALSRGASVGPQRTLSTIAGSTTGFALLIGLSMSGVGAMIVASERAYLLLRIAGAVYLVWLGWKTWRAPAPTAAAVTDPVGPDFGAPRLYVEGLLVSFANPKVILFFAAFLPPFIDTARPLAPQFLVMAMTFLAFEALVEFALACGAARLLPLLGRERPRRIFQRVTGGAFIGAGIGLALAHV